MKNSVNHKNYGLEPLLPAIHSNDLSFRKQIAKLKDQQLVQSRHWFSVEISFTVKENPEKHQRQMEWIIPWRHLFPSVNNGGLQVTKLRCLTVMELKLDGMNQTLNTNTVQKKRVQTFY